LVVVSSELVRELWEEFIIVRELWEEFIIVRELWEEFIIVRAVGFRNYGRSLLLSEQ